MVFDGRSGDGPDEQESLVMEVLFSPRDKTADTVIEQLVFQAGPAGRVIVVTSDRGERETTETAGAETKTDHHSRGSGNPVLQTVIPAQAGFTLFLFQRSLTLNREP